MPTRRNYMIRLRAYPIALASIMVDKKLLGAALAIEWLKPLPYSRRQFTPTA